MDKKEGKHTRVERIGRAKGKRWKVAVFNRTVQDPLQ